MARGRITPIQNTLLVNRSNSATDTSKSFGRVYSVPVFKSSPGPKIIRSSARQTSTSAGGRVTTRFI